MRTITLASAGYLVSYHSYFISLLMTPSRCARQAVEIQVALYLLVISLFCATTSGNDNPFGLPAPIEANKWGAVMLHGGGRAEDDKFRTEIREEFARLAGGKQAKLVVIPSETAQPIARETLEQWEKRMASPEEYGRWARLETDGRVESVKFMHYKMPEDKYLALLKNATGVWMPAVDQTVIAKRFAGEYPTKTSKFQLELRGVVARGGIVGGLGGGMSCLPETMIAGDDETSDGWNRAELGFGLALLKGLIVDQNFNIHTGRLERLSDALRNGPVLDVAESRPGVERRTIGLGVERGTAVVLRNNTIRVLGAGSGHLFLKSNGDRTITMLRISPGDDLVTVQSNANGGRYSRTVTERSVHERPNPFGLPTPNNPEKPGTVVLHGGQRTRGMYDLFPVLTRKANPKILHCPVAIPRYQREFDPLSEPQDRQKELQKYFSKEGFDGWLQLPESGRAESVSFVTTTDPRHANLEAFVAPLTTADAMWFSGGDQGELARLFVDSVAATRFQQEFIEIVKRGGVVGGTSAGLAIMAEVMIVNDEKVARGLGVLRQAVVDQHFDARKGRIDRLTKLLSNHGQLATVSPGCRSGEMVGLAVEESAALIVQGNRVRVAGESRRAEFADALRALIAESTAKKQSEILGKTTIEAFMRDFLVEIGAVSKAEAAYMTTDTLRKEFGYYFQPDNRKLAHIFLQSADSRILTWHTLRPGDAAYFRFENGGYVLELDDWNAQ